MRKFILTLSLLLLTACAPAPTYLPGPPKQTATITVPPLPSLTPWSTKTPSPTHTPTSTPLACWHIGGKLVDDLVPSSLLPAPIPVSIYLPPCFDAYPENTYAVLYLFHGQGYDQTQWPRLGITSLADDWITTGQIPPFLIVMPGIEDWDGPSSNPFGQAVIEEIIPYVEAQYRARHNRADRVVGGISRGGSWALHLGLKYWQTFSAIGGHSLPIFHEDAPYIPYWLEAIPKDQMPAIYVDYAVSDQSVIRRSAADFLALLDEKGIAYTFSTAPGSHVESYWAAQIENYFGFYVNGLE